MADGVTCIWAITKLVKVRSVNSLQVDLDHGSLTAIPFLTTVHSSVSVSVASAKEINYLASEHPLTRLFVALPTLH
jgi:hypothetical protein